MTTTTVVLSSDHGIYRGEIDVRDSQTRPGLFEVATPGGLGFLTRDETVALVRALVSHADIQPNEIHRP